MNTSTISWIILGTAGLIAFYTFVMPRLGNKGVQEGKSATFRPMPIIETPFGLGDPVAWRHIGDMRYEAVTKIGNNEKTFIIDEATDYLEPKNSKVETYWGSGAAQIEWHPFAKEHKAKTQESQSIVEINKLQEKNEQVQSDLKLQETTSDLQLDKKVEDATALAKAGKQPAQRFGQR